MAEHTLYPSQSERLDISPDEPDSREGDGETDECGADLSRGGTCERPAEECPYHD